jgi:hypothetical protein
MEINGKDILVNVYLMALTGDMPQQAANAGLLSHRAITGCRTCYCQQTERADLSYDTVLKGRYHFETIHKREIGNKISVTSQRRIFWSKHGLQTEESPLEKLSPALDLILGRPYDIPHSEWKGLGRRIQELLITEILTTSGLQAYQSAFQQFPVPAGWPRIQSLKHLKSWSLSEAGRAIILTPLILRCHSKDSWFKQSYLQHVTLALEPFQHQPDKTVLSRPELIIRAYGIFAKAVSAVSTATALSESLALIIFQGRQAFQCLMQVMTYTRETSRIAYTKIMALPNVHVGVHLAQFAKEYGTVMNCNVLAGELKHRLVILVF